MSKQYVAKITQTGAWTRLNATTERGAKAEASKWQSYADRNYCMSLYVDCSGEPIARKANGHWTSV